MEMESPRTGQGARAGKSIAADSSSLTRIPLPRPLFDDLTRYQALHMMQTLGVRPELATMLASLAFGGGK